MPQAVWISTEHWIQSVKIFQRRGSTGMYDVFVGYSLLQDWQCCRNFLPAQGQAGKRHKRPKEKGLLNAFLEGRNGQASCASDQLQTQARTP